MKNVRTLLIASAVAASVVSPMAAAELKVYGKASLSLENAETKGISSVRYLTAGDAASRVDTTTLDDKWQVTSHASRFGVKGDNELNDWLKAVYIMEWEIDMADNTNSSADHIKARNQYVGLKSNSFGEIIIGRNDTPVKTAQGKIDLFNDLPGDIKNVMEGEQRQNNMIQYSTPNFLDLVQAKLMLVPGESGAQGYDDPSTAAKDCDTLSTPEDECTLSVRDGIADGKSLSVVVEPGNFYIAAAVDMDMPAKNSGTNFTIKNGGGAAIDYTPNQGFNGYTSAFRFVDTTRLVFMYKVKSFGGGVLVQSSELSNTNGNVAANTITAANPNARSNPGKEESIMFSGYYKLAFAKFKGQLIETENFAGDDIDATSLSVGVDFQLGEKTILGVYNTQNEFEHNGVSIANFDGLGNAYAANAGTVSEVNTFGVNLEHSF
ncbi:MAG: porin [Gammaproteobacteria bacterium]|nr:porin [Gammaproteobacteria bacterium]